jgi:hypothetical protein
VLIINITFSRCSLGISRYRHWAARHAYAHKVGSAFVEYRLMSSGAKVARCHSNIMISTCICFVSMSMSFFLRLCFIERVSTFCVGAAKCFNSALSDFPVKSARTYQITQTTARAHKDYHHHWNRHRHRSTNASTAPPPLTLTLTLLSNNIG